VLAQKLESAAIVEPRILLPVVQAEGDAGIEGIGGILADIERGQGMPALDGAVLRRVHHLQWRNDLAAGEGLDFKLSLRELAHPPAEILDRAEQGIEALGPARCKPPADCGLTLRCGRHSRRSRKKAARSRLLEKHATLHAASSMTIERRC
jgi:hypothetical protein